MQNSLSMIVKSKVIFLQGENNKVPIFNGRDGVPIQPSAALPPQKKHPNGTNADASDRQQHEDHGGGPRIYVLPGKSLFWKQNFAKLCKAPTQLG